MASCGWCPKATTAGLAAIDPADGRTVTTVPLDAAISDLVVSAAGQATYARMILIGVDPGPLRRRASPLTDDG
jgi:hypothetical protein